MKMKNKDIKCRICGHSMIENSIEYMDGDFWSVYFECPNCKHRSPEICSEDSLEDAVEGAIIAATRPRSYKPLNKKELSSRRSGEEIFVIKDNQRKWATIVDTNGCETSDSGEDYPSMEIVYEDDNRIVYYHWNHMYTWWTAWDHEPTEIEYNAWLNWQAEYQEKKNGYFYRK